MKFFGCCCRCWAVERLPAPDALQMSYTHADRLVVVVVFASMGKNNKRKKKIVNQFAAGPDNVTLGN